MQMYFFYLIPLRFLSFFLGSDLLHHRCLSHSLDIISLFLDVIIFRFISSFVSLCWISSCVMLGCRQEKRDARTRVGEGRGGGGMGWGTAEEGEGWGRAGEE